MKRWFLFLVFIGLIVFLASCGSNSESDNSGVNNQGADSETTLSGDDIYKRSCANCHGGELEGVSGPPLANVSSKYSVDEIKDIINNGKGNMFPVNLPSDEIDVLVAWLTEKQ